MAGFSSLDVGASGQGQSGNSIHISVSDPVKQNEGINAYITYKVNTQTDRPEFQYKQYSVVRRYSDFVWLQQKLSHAFPGAIVPPLPEKSLVGRFETGFVEVRRRALEKFLNRVAVHPELVTAKQLAVFLQADDAGLAQAKVEERVKPAVTQPKKMMEMFSNAVNHVQHSFQQGASELPKAPSDPVFEEITAYVHSLEAEFGKVHKETGVLIKRERDLSEALFQFGLALTLLAQSEVAGLGDALRDLGHTADQLSVASASEAEKESLQLEEPMTEYCRLVASVKTALNQRHQAKVAYHNALLEFESKTAMHNKLAAQPGKEEKASVADAAAQKAKTAADEAKKEFETVSERFLREFQRFKAEKGDGLKRIMLDYIKLQIEYHKDLTKSWSDLLPKIEAADTTDISALPQGGPQQQESKSAGPPRRPGADRIGGGPASATAQNHFDDRGDGMGDSTLIGV